MECALKKNQEDTKSSFQQIMQKLEAISTSMEDRIWVTNQYDKEAACKRGSITWAQVINYQAIQAIQDRYDSGDTHNKDRPEAWSKLLQ